MDTQTGETSGSAAAAAPTTRETEVLVVGAGPSGLVLACDLARRGVVATVVERSAALFPGSRGKGLQPRTLEVFDDLGVIGAALAAGCPYPAVAHWEDGVRTGEWAMMESLPASPQRPYDQTLMLPQWRTQEILHARLTELGGTVEFGLGLTGLTQDGSGVTAELTDADGGACRIRARYLVGADGGRSTVRRGVGTGMTGGSVASGRMLVADVRATGLDRLNWHTWSSPEGILGMCPLPGGDVFQVMAQFGDECDEGAADAGPDPSADGVREVIARRSHLTAGQVTEVLWASLYRPRVALADRFRTGRVFLVGDAAHIHPPTGGQGLNTSVQDAYNLGWKLGQVLRHGAPDTLLDTYEEERLPVAADVLGLSTRILHAARDNRNGPATGKRGPETQQLGIGYRGASLSVDTRPDPAAAISTPSAPHPTTAPARTTETPAPTATSAPTVETTALAPTATSAPTTSGSAPAKETASRTPDTDSPPAGDRTPDTDSPPAGDRTPDTDSLRAGDRAPDARGTTPDGLPVRLFDVFRGPHVTLLAVGGSVEPPAVPAPWVRTCRADGAEVRDAYGEGLFLIRPDGYVGLATGDPAAVADYLARLHA